MLVIVIVAGKSGAVQCDFENIIKFSFSCRSVLLSSVSNWQADDGRGKTPVFSNPCFLLFVRAQQSLLLHAARAVAAVIFLFSAFCSVCVIFSSLFVAPFAARGSPVRPPIDIQLKRVHFFFT